MKVFLSYAAEDRPTAVKIGHALRKAGHDVYPGSRWPVSAGSAVQRADAFVAILSKDATASPFVERELDLALRSANIAGRLIPVFVEASPAAPWILKNLRPIYLRDGLTAAARAVVARLSEKIQ